MSRACRICIATDPPTGIIVSKQHRSGRTGHVDWKRQVASGIAGVPVFDPVGVDVVTDDLVIGIYLISKGCGCVWHFKRNDNSLTVKANERWLRTVTENSSTNNVAGIVNSQ